MAEIRMDGYINTIIGHGLKQFDPFSRGRFGGAENWLVDYREADNIYTFNGLARRIISLPSDDALRKGFDVKANGEKVDEATEKRLKTAELMLLSIFTCALITRSPAMRKWAYLPILLSPMKQERNSLKWSRETRKILIFGVGS